MTPQTNAKILLYIRVFCVLLVVLLGYRVYTAIQLHQHTGTLEVTTNKEPDAVITISQPGHQAGLLGMGDVIVRLKPGDYLVAAKLDGNQTYGTVHIAAGYKTTKALNPIQTNVLPATSTVGFINFDALTNDGLSVDQLNYLENLLGKFAPNATTMSLDPTTVNSAPHDPSSSAPFELDFNVIIDKTTYAARLQYPDTENIQLYLLDASGAQVYAGYAPSSNDT